jgi:predicted DNA-binding transcriptional regulator YafY
MRPDQMTRQWRLLTFLVHSGSGHTVRQLAEALDFKERTLYRDLEALTAAGFPVTEARRQGSSFFRWSGHSLESSLAFDAEEWLALGVAVGELEAHGLGEFSGALLRLAARVSGAGARPRSGGARVVQRLRPAGPERTLETIARAAAARRTLRMLYQPREPQAARWRRVDPYAVFHKGDEAYLVGFCHERHEVRSFKASRAARARLEAAEFAPPADFSLSEYLEGGFGVARGGPRSRVVLAFSREVEQLVREHPWPEGTKTEDLGEAGIEVVMSVAVTAELESWLLSFGPDVQVLEPKRLRARVLERLEAAVRRAREAPADRRQLRLFTLSGRERVRE